MGGSPKKKIKENSKGSWDVFVEYKVNGWSMRSELKNIDAPTVAIIEASLYQKHKGNIKITDIKILQQFHYS
jgi:hypothetical protein